MAEVDRTLISVQIVKDILEVGLKLVFYKDFQSQVIDSGLKGTVTSMAS